MISPTILTQLQTEKVPFRGARWFTPTTGRKVSLIVIHSMEAPDKPGTAQGVARYFQTLTRKASAHYCIDSEEVIQCVQTKDVAYAAPGANSNGVHLELAGYAAEEEATWESSLQELENAAWLCGLILIPKFHIPIRFLKAVDLRAGGSGFTTHAEVSKAFKKSTHTDPGANFPVNRFLSLVTEATQHFTK